MSNGGIIGPVNDPVTSIASSPGTATFTASGTYTSGPQAKFANILIVAGGGGGGNNTPDNREGGGGGAGGLILYPSAPITTATSYPIVIGGGGASNTAGVDSTGLSLTAKGGGRGAPAGNQAGGAGGSGGGQGHDNAGIGPATQPTQPGNSGAFGFGNPGGFGSGQAFLPLGFIGLGGGGGGAGAIGGDTVIPYISGSGGAGKDVTPLFGAAPQPFYLANSPGRGPTSTGIFAGGGAGGIESPSATAGTGGPGGGGNGGRATGISGTTNSGGGGGGSGTQSPVPGPTTSGAGGSGIAVVRELTKTQASGVWSLQEQYNFKKQGNWI